MPTITLTRTDSEERIGQLAIALWYNVEILEWEKEEDVFDWDKKVGTQLVPNMIVNEQSYLDFVTKHFQKKIDNEIASVFIEIAKTQLRQKQVEEERLLEEQVRASVWETVIS